MHGHLWVWGLACGMRFHRRWRAGGRQPLWCFAMTVSRCRSTSGSSDVHFLLIPGGSDSKESACSAGNLGSIPGWGRSPREGNSDPLQYSCLENPMDRGACRLQSMGSQRVEHDLVTEQHQQPRSIIIEPCGHSIFSFLKNLHTVFYSAGINLHPHY